MKKCNAIVFSYRNFNNKHLETNPPKADNSDRPFNKGRDQIGNFIPIRPRPFEKRAAQREIVQERKRLPIWFYVCLIVLLCIPAVTSAKDSQNIVNLDTAGKSPLAKNIKIVRQDGGRVSWSPSGDNLIVFDRMNADGYFDVYTMTTDGKIVSSITDGNLQINQRHNGDPVWHPSGKYIVFKSEEKMHLNIFNKWPSNPGIGVFCNLWATTPDGKQLWKLTDIPIKKTLKDRIPSTGVLFPRFSHDGSKLVWSERYRDCAKIEKCKWGKWRLKMADFVVDEQGPHLENERIIFEPKGKMGDYVNTMSFSPDDAKLLVVGNLDGQDEYGMDQYILNLKSKQLTNLTNTPDVWEEGACWSPDGKYIVYMTNIGSPVDFTKEWTEQHTTREYWIMDADGSNKQRLTYFNEPGVPEYIGKPAIVAQCSFSPDSKKLLGILGVDFGTQQKPKIELKLILIELK